jgi:hypothetical protein
MAMVRQGGLYKVGDEKEEVQKLYALVLQHRSLEAPG